MSQFGYAGIIQEDYNQQLKFDFGEKRLLKETVIKHYEEIDSEGRRRIHKETTEKKWFMGNNSHHNPTVSHHSEYL